MKAKLLSIPIVLLLCLSMTITVSQATKPQKLIEHQVFEAPFDSGWCKAVFHGTMIVKGVSNGDLTLYDVTVTMLQKLNLYSSEGGELVAVVKVQMQYTGTVTTLAGGEDPTEAFYTGKMVTDIVINEIQEGWLLPDAPENSHWIVWYEQGEPIKAIGFGQPFFP